MNTSQPLNLDRFATLAQSSRHLEKTSERYSFIPTLRPMEVLAQSGWHPSKVQEAYTRKESNRGFQKHLVRFRNESLPFVNGHIPEIVLSNCHMGAGSFELSAGVFRQVCTNGLMLGQTYEKFTIRHVGYTDDAVNAAVQRLISMVPQIGNAIERLGAIQLSRDEQLQLAATSIEMIRGDDDKFSVNPSDMISPVRYSDARDSSLWTTFNTIQERAMRGGYRMTAENGSRRRSRAVKSIDKGVRINRNLWTIAEAMAALKGGASAQAAAVQ